MIIFNMFWRHETLGLQSLVLTGLQDFASVQNKFVSWLVVLGLTALLDSISVYIEPYPRESEKRKEMIDEIKKNNLKSKQPPPAPTASAVGPCPTLIQIVGHPDTRLEVYPAPSHHPTTPRTN